LFKSDFFKNFINNCKSLWNNASDIDGLVKDSIDFVGSVKDVKE